jgi:predicted nuclease of restriction endonuclease-like (RecB) superfamily
MSLTPSPDFSPVLELIRQARTRTLTAINYELIDLYWQLGQYLSEKVNQESWGKGKIQQLVAWLNQQEFDSKGFSASNLWRMRQFYDTYAGSEKLAPVVRELLWTHNLIILGKCNSNEEREFYLKTAIQQRWNKRDLERQINASLFERTLANPAQVSTTLKELQPNAQTIFKDSYLIDFLGLPEHHNEADVRRGLVGNLKQFLLELGTGFTFVGEEYRIQVGKQDFFIDLLFFHRGLQALVAFELKIDDFKPAYMGQLEFYLEALDRDHKQPHEAPSIGVLLCKSADSEVVEYTLARTASPALVAKYLTQLPNKELLRAKLEEFYELLKHNEENYE